MKKELNLNDIPLGSEHYFDDYEFNNFVGRLKRKIKRDKPVSEQDLSEFGKRTEMRNKSEEELQIKELTEGSIPKPTPEKVKKTYEVITDDWLNPSQIANQIGYLENAPKIGEKVSGIPMIRWASKVVEFRKGNILYTIPLKALKELNNSPLFTAENPINSSIKPVIPTDSGVIGSGIGQELEIQLRNKYGRAYEKIQVAARQIFVKNPDLSWDTALLAAEKKLIKEGEIGVKRKPRISGMPLVAAVRGVGRKLGRPFRKLIGRNKEENKKIALNAREIFDKNQESWSEALQRSEQQLIERGEIDQKVYASFDGEGAFIGYEYDDNSTDYNDDEEYVTIK